MAHLYILQTSKGRYYIGSTEKLEQRLHAHRCGMVKTTKSGLPVTLIYLERFTTRGEAQKREYEIKKWKNKERITKLIQKASTEAPSSIG